MAIRVWPVGHDTADAEKIARFLSEALRRPIRDGTTSAFAAIEIADAALLLTYRQVPEGKTVKNRAFAARNVISGPSRSTVGPRCDPTVKRRGVSHGRVGAFSRAKSGSYMPIRPSACAHVMLMNAPWDGGA